MSTCFCLIFPIGSYFFDSMSEADRVCDELKRVCIAYEKRPLEEDRLGEPAVEEPDPHAAVDVAIVAHIDEVRVS